MRSSKCAKRNGSETESLRRLSNSENQFRLHRTAPTVCALFLTLLGTTQLVSGPVTAFTSAGEHPCTYDFELQTSTMRISCPGSPSTVNVYADTASLLTQDLQEADSATLHSRQVHDGNGNSPDTSDGSESRQTPSGGGSRSPSRQYGGHGHQIKPDGKDTFTSHVWNASKRLDEARRSLAGYTTSLENISVRLAEGRLTLDSDMDKLRRETETPDELKQGIVAAMTNQFTFMRTVLLTRNQELQQVLTSLDLLLDVTSEGMHSALDSHKMTVDKVDSLNGTLVSVRSMLTAELRKNDKRRRRVGKQQGKKSKQKGEDG